MSATPQQYIAIQLSCLDQQTITIALRNNCVAVREPDLEATVGDDLLERQAGSFDVKVAFHNLYVRGDAAQELVCFFVGEVSETQDLSDLPRREELAKLQRALRTGLGEGPELTLAGISYTKSA